MKYLLGILIAMSFLATAGASPPLGASDPFSADHLFLVEITNEDGLKALGDTNPIRWNRRTLTDDTDPARGSRQRTMAEDTDPGRGSRQRTYWEDCVVFNDSPYEPRGINFGRRWH